SSHDKFRGLDGAWESTVKGAELLNKHGIEFQFQLSVTKDNCDEVESIVEFAYEKGARAMNVFFLVCTGRGQDMTDITPQQYEKVLIQLSDLDKKYAGKMMVRGRCAPHFLRVVQQRDPDSPVMKGATSGCIAGTHYFRITPQGDVTPCPYMPTVVGNVRKQSLAEIWGSSPVFDKLRNPVYNGRCADCEFSDVCGGCRARALAASGDLMGEDPWCEHKPTPPLSPPYQGGVAGKKVVAEIVWDDEAIERLGKVPFFLRSMVKKGLERYAKAKGLTRITPDIMEEMRKKVGSGKREVKI
ncbi:MAG: SPASM domain-containing protein, partial [Deltaproteobacteria bacterium]